MAKTPRELYADIVGSQPDLKVKGKKMHYTAVNGNMFSFVAADDVMSLRLPKDALEAFLKKHRTTLSVQYNTVMKEYALIPASLLKKSAQMNAYFAESYAYAQSLKPKPTTKTKATKKKATKKKATKKKATKKKATKKKATKTKATKTKATTKKATKKKATKKKATKKKATKARPRKRT